MARQSSLTPEMLAAFQAKGGKIVRIETGEGVGLTDRQWYAGTQGRLDLNRKIRGYSVSVEETERQAERRREVFHDARYNGASVSEALDAANTAHLDGETF